MCRICVVLCEEIRKTFGRIVCPYALQELIESSPVDDFGSQTKVIDFE